MASSAGFKLVGQIIIGNEEMVRSLKLGQRLRLAVHHSHVWAINLVGGIDVEIHIPGLNIDGAMRREGHSICHH